MFLLKSKIEFVLNYLDETAPLGRTATNRAGRVLMKDPHITRSDESQESDHFHTATFRYLESYLSVICNQQVGGSDLSSGFLLCFVFNILSNNFHEVQ